MSTRVFIGNLSYQTTKDDLTQLLSAAGQIVDIHLPIDRQTGGSRGIAFVEFSNDAEADAAIQKFDGQDLGGRALRVNIAEDRPASGPSGPHGGFKPGFGKKPFKNKGSRRGIRGRKRSL